MHPHEHPSHHDQADNFTIVMIIILLIICWPAVIINQVLPWCFGRRRKLNKAVSVAVDKSDLIRYLFITAWVIVTLAGWFFSIYYLCF